METTVTKYPKRSGLSVAIAYKNPLLEKLHRMRPKTHLYLPPKIESEHFVVSGAPGAGKTMTIQHLVDSAKARAKREGRKLVCIFFDPHRTYIQRYWKPGAWIGNPYDARSFSWCPTWELDLSKKMASRARCLAMARSLYVGRQSQTSGDNSTEFFTRASQLCFEQLVVNHQPAEAQELAYWFENPDEEIAPRVTGKVRRDLDPGSMQQANGIYSSVSMPQLALEAVPLSGWVGSDGVWVDNAPRWTVNQYLKDLDHDIFFTSTPDTIEALQPLQSMWLDMLFRGLRRRPVRDGYEVMVVIDELRAAQRLPQLELFANEVRKFGVTLILGFQSRPGLDPVYGKDVVTAIVSACKTQFYHRAGEHDTGKSQSDNVGEVLYEELTENWTTKIGEGNKPRTVTTQEKRKPLIIPSQFTGLRDRDAYLKIGNEVLHYRGAISQPYIAAVDFIPRKDSPVIKGVKRSPPKKKEPKQNSPKKAVPEGRRDRAKSRPAAKPRNRDTGTDVRAAFGMGSE